MAVTGKPGVGEVLASWMNSSGVTPTRMARLAQVSRATVYKVLGSESRSPITMRQLAAGLATYTDRSGHEIVDPEIERKAIQDLLSAAGYEALVGELPAVTDELEERIAVETGDRAVGVGLARITREWSDLDESDQAVIMAAVNAALGHSRRRQAEQQRSN